MTILGSLDVDKYGQIHRRLVIDDVITAPDSDVNIDAGGTATITINVANETPRDVEVAGVVSVSGLPSTVYIKSISFDSVNKTVSIELYNSDTANPVTISAGSLSIRVIVVS